MSRYRWFRAEWPIPMRTLAKRLKAKSFSEKNSDGFIVDRVRDNFIDARYVERIEYIDKILDPFGKELLFDRVEFKQCEFRISVTDPGLELIDAPRGTQGLVSRLLEASDFSLAISPISIDVLKWAERFQKLAQVSGTVDVLQIGALELETGIFAKMAIKGSKDVRKASNVFIGGSKHLVEKIQIRLSGTNYGTVLLTNTGSAKLDVDDPSELIAKLRESLADIIRS